MKRILLVWLFLIAIYPIYSHAQIGYQVALLNNVTGEPRANESVSVEVKITDGEGKTVCSETKSATTNEFGILSLSVGSNEVFNKVDWSKQPFFISATIDDVLIGKSQILSVPIAEYAKRTGQLTKELLKSKTWKFIRTDNDGYVKWELFFDDNYMTIQETSSRYSGMDSFKYLYDICGNTVVAPGGVALLFNFHLHKVSFIYTSQDVQDF